MASAASYENFLREHVDFPTTNTSDPLQYCNRMMKRRKMATPSHCKHLNTFLHADPFYIQAVCGDGGTPTTGDLRESEAVFPLTLCRLLKSSWAPDCRYEGNSSTEKIIIACEDGQPVHLETEVPSVMEPWD
ncbi:probable inactive ribonuclease-like protein 12 [Tiliqua scincoides]|uniref:probable inactive ribonuclease-like protein 12 n=1 Tax=Tiliqua scincoides TaxID=71010 RepID=UPI0034627BB1